jgi:hypothetical protein
MEHLLRLILALPLEHVAAWVFFKKALEDEYQQDIFNSIFFHAVRKNALSEQEAKELLSDPLTTEMEKCNDKMVVIFEEKHGSLGQEMRLDIQLKWLQTCESARNPILLQKIGQLYDICQVGYAANTLASLYASLTEANKEQKIAPQEEKSHAVILAVVTELQKKSFIPTDEVFNQIKTTVLARYRFFYLLSERNKKAHLLLLCKLDYELKLYKQSLAAFIESEQKQVEEKKNSSGCKKISELYETVLLLQHCLYDIEKNALQRLEMFKNEFIEHYKQLGLTNKINVDNTTQLFLETIAGLLTKYKVFFVPPANNTASWGIALFAQSAMAAIWGEREGAPTKSHDDCLPSAPKA